MTPLQGKREVSRYNHTPMLAEKNADLFGI